MTQAPQPASRRRASRPPARHAHGPCRANCTTRPCSPVRPSPRRSPALAPTLQALGAERARERARARPAAASRATATAPPTNRRSL